MSQYTKEEILQHRAEWVAALRSGDYPQTTGDLRNAEGYCCLGVACELAGVGAVQDPPYASWFEYDGNSSVLPDSVRAWLGVRVSDPHSAHDAVFSAMNDSGDYSFEQIADHFEQHGFHPSIDVLAQKPADV